MTALAPAIPYAMAGAQLFAGAAQARAERQAGLARQREYEQQAALAQLRGRQEALAYKQKGVDILGNLNETLAAIIARASKGAGDATSGSTVTFAQAQLGRGLTEANTAADNATLAIEQAAAQASIYREAGRTAAETAYIQGTGTLFNAVIKAGQLLPS